MLIREKPPLRLAASIVTPNGVAYRWAPDERKSENTYSGLTFSDTMPGGFEHGTLVLPRKPQLDYADLVELSTVTISGPGASRPAWEGRMETTPRVSGNQMAISPGLTGWQAHLADDNSARMIYVDISFANWTGPTINRQIYLLSISVDYDNASVSPDPYAKLPALKTAMVGQWARQHVAEAWYYANGLPIGKLYYAWNISAFTIQSTDANWSWQAGLFTTETSLGDSTGNLRAAGPGTGLVAASAGTRVFALLQADYAVAGGGAGEEYAVYWTALGVYGNHGLTLRGTPSATQPYGVLCSDVESHAIGTWAPKLNFTTGANGTIQPSTFIIPQLTFPDPTTCSAILKAATAFEFRDWAVWENRTYWSNALGAVGRKWRARVGPTNLQEAGPQIDRLWNGVIVTYTDVTGINRSVGPPGSGANTTDATLLDTDPLNPTNQLSPPIRRWATLKMGTSTPAGATTVGALFLQQQKQLNSSGTCAIVGYIEDDTGSLYPAWVVRSGDQIAFMDAAITSYRRIVSKTYDDSTKTATLTLDTPPDSLQALLARLQVVLTNYGGG